jgi:hypothetical protein
VCLSGSVPSVCLLASVSLLALFSFRMETPLNINDQQAWGPGGDSDIALVLLLPGLRLKNRIRRLI